jgi:hypothetical protein
VWRETEGVIVYFDDSQGMWSSNSFGRGSFNSWSIAMADYNRDGLVDLYFTNFGNSKNRLYRNDGNGSFTLMSTKDVGALVNVGSFGGACWADFDDDGWPDLYAGSLQANRSLMFRNDGHGGFVAVTNVVTKTTGPSLSGAWGDYDNDGRLDLCVVRFNGTTTVYRNLGDGQFEQTASAPTLTGIHNSASWADYDNDGFLDLFVSGYMSENKLFHNNGDGSFTRVTTGSVVNDRARGGAGSYTGMWFDYDRDGFLDLYVGNGDDNTSIQPRTSSITTIPTAITGYKCVWSAPPPTRKGSAPKCVRRRSSPSKLAGNAATSRRATSTMATISTLILVSVTLRTSTSSASNGRRARCKNCAM